MKKGSSCRKIYPGVIVDMEKKKKNKRWKIKSLRQDNDGGIIKTNRDQ